MSENKISQQVIDDFYEIMTASVSDAVDKVVGKKGFMSHKIKPLFKSKIVGPATTVKHVQAPLHEPPRHAMEAIDNAGKGGVVVISGEDTEDIALLGGLMGTAAKVQGLTGVVLGGALRDADELEELGLPVFSTGIVPSTSLGRTRTIGYNIPITCGGVPVHPGDLIVGDRDGIVVVPKDHIDEVLKTAKEIEETEKKQTEDIFELKSIVKVVEKWSRV